MPRTSTVTLCSFCGKSHAEVRKLVAGPGVYICDNCIAICRDILDKELGNGEEEPLPPQQLAPAAPQLTLPPALPSVRSTR